MSQVVSNAETISHGDELFARARRVLPGGVSRNTVFRRPRPFYASFGSGCYVTDLDGVRRIDFSNNMASLIHGHAHPEIVAAVSRQLGQGTAFSMATEVEVRFAELLCDRVPGFENIRFVNSGTEAVMVAIKAARCATGRPKIAKVEGTYHGTYDYAEASQKPSPDNWGPAERPTSVPLTEGTPSGALQDVVVIPFNDFERARLILDQYAEDIACVLIDPLPHRVGMIPASDEFVEQLRSWTENHGALLVFDEVITFRSEYAGAQAWYGVRPDLTSLGKIIGGGFPVGALAGKASVMAVLDPTQEVVRFPHSGTFSANPITMTAGLVAMQLFDQQAVSRLNQLGDLAREKITEAIRLTGVQACVTGAGSMFRVHLKKEPPRDYRCAYMSGAEWQRLTMLVDFLFDHGCMMINTCSGALSTAMTEREIEHLTSAMRDGFELLQRQSPN